MTDEIPATKVTPEMAAIVGKVMRESVSYPVAISDIRKWAIAVYYPDDPPRLFWDEEYAATTEHGGVVAPEEFNPFAWATQKPSIADPRVTQTAFSEDELGVRVTAFNLVDNETLVDLELSQTDESERAIAIGAAQVALRS